MTKELSALSARRIMVSKSAQRMPRSSDEILRRALPNPAGSELVLDIEESIKFYSEALSVRENSFETGTFILTDMRYIFLGRHGRKSEDLASVTAVSVDYDYLIGLVSLELPRVTSGSVHIMSISTRTGSKDSFGLIPDNKEYIETVAEALLKLRQMGKENRSASKSIINIVIDFGSLHEYMDKGGLLLGSVKCPQCGANLDLPKEGKSTKCRYCKTTIYAQDLFEGIKDLVGSRRR